MIEQIVNSWKQQPVQVLSTIGVLSGILSVCFSFVVIQTNLNQVLTRWGSDFKLNIYLTDTAEEKDIEAIRKKLSEDALFRKNQYVTKDQALENFRSRLGFLGSELVSEGNLDNPLPASFEAVINTSMDDFIKKLEAFSKSILINESVEDVSYGQNWVENYAGLVVTWKYIGLFVGLILAAGALLLSAGTIRSSIFLRKDEIEIMELFGATKMVIAKPFIVEGALIGLISGILSVVAVAIIYHTSLSLMSEQIKLWNLTDVLSFSNVFIIFLYVATCASIGALGSLLSVRKINTGWAAAERA